MRSYLIENFQTFTKPKSVRSFIPLLLNCLNETPTHRILKTLELIITQVLPHIQYPVSKILHTIEMLSILINLLRHQSPDVLDNFEDYVFWQATLKIDIMIFEPLFGILRAMGPHHLAEVSGSRQDFLLLR